MIIWNLEGDKVTYHQSPLPLEGEGHVEKGPVEKGIGCFATDITGNQSFIFARISPHAKEIQCKRFTPTSNVPSAYILS